MGGTNSRVGTKPPCRQTRPPKRTFSSFFQCGGGFSSLLICGKPYPSQIEDDLAESLENSAGHGMMDKLQNPRTDTSLSSSAGSGSTSPESQMRRSTYKPVTASSICQSRDGSSDATSSSKPKYLVGNKQLFHTHQVVSDRNRGETSTTSINREVYGRNTISKDICSSLTHHDRSSSTELGETSSDESSNEIPGTAVMAFSNFDSSSASNISDSSFSNCISRAVSGLNLSERGLVRRDDNSLLGDVASSSEIFATSSRRDSERRNRRLCGDALSRRSRGYHNSRNYFLSNDDFDNLGHRDIWLHDLSRDFLGEGVGGSLRTYENGTQDVINHQWNSTSEISGSTRGALEINVTRTTCPSAIHLRGPCSCESILRGERFGSRASISRIVMLAEALFEVLDEIHRQPLSGPLPVVSVPAEESVVNSLPIKNYIKPEESVCSDDAAKCYICLDEYEDGDNIRTLPCKHEYHVSCIDKWLKEIHSICPLCRADVKEGFTKSSNST